MDVAENAATTISYGDDSATLKNEPGDSVDDYTADDYMYPLNAGDATANSNATTDRTAWL